VILIGDALPGWWGGHHICLMTCFCLPDRSVKAGRLLAEQLLARTALGHRPLILCGYSAGALLIWS
jgi:hypothetical protein